MLNVEHGRQQGFGKGRRRLGILPQDMGRDSSQPRFVSALQFLEDKRAEPPSAARDGRARAAARRACASPPACRRRDRPRDARRATSRKVFGEGAVSTADLDDADEVGLRAYLLGRAQIDRVSRGTAPSRNSLRRQVSSSADALERLEVLGESALRLGGRFGRRARLLAGARLPAEFLA